MLPVSFAPSSNTFRIWGVLIWHFARLTHFVETLQKTFTFCWYLKQFSKCDTWARDFKMNNVARQSPLEGEEGGSLRLVENPKRRTEEAASSGFVRHKAKTRKETTKKRQRASSSSSSSSLPPVWHLVPVTCLYLLLLLLLHLLSPILTNLPYLPTSSSPPPTCGLYNQSITRHSSL